MNIHHYSFGWLHAPPNPKSCCHCLLIEQDGDILLVDTGIGMHDVADPVGRIGQAVIDLAGYKFIEAATALRHVERLGDSADDVKEIVLTHCDGDHAGGLSDFPAATVHVSREEKQSLDAGHPRYCPAQFQHQPKWVVHSDEQEKEWFGLRSRPVENQLGLDIRLIPLFGHTQGHCGVAIATEGKWLLHVGDAYFLRDQLTVDDHPVNDFAKMAAVDETGRRASLELLRRLVNEHGEQIEYCGYHDVGELPVEVAGQF